MATKAFTFVGKHSLLAFAIALATLALGVKAPAIYAAVASQERQSRPMVLGTSGGNINANWGKVWCSSGTLGALVTKGGEPYILSNNHVLARENKASVGDDVNQPGLIDVNCQKIPGDVVADLSEWVPLQFRRGVLTSVDAAIAKVRAGMVDPEGTILGVGTVSNLPATARVGCAVQKAGRTTGLTAGSVSATDATVTVRYSNGTATFTNQIMVTPASFSASGDSGSLVVRQGTNPRPVGLLYAGSSTSTIANPIADVLVAFGASMVGSGDGSSGDCPQGSPDTSEAVANGRDVKGRHTAALMNLPDVVGVAVGADGAVEVYLERENANTRRQIPAALESVPVRVIVTGAFEAR